MEADDSKIIVPDHVCELLEIKILDNNRREIERIKEAVIL